MAAEIKIEGGVSKEEKELLELVETIFVFNEMLKKKIKGNDSLKRSLVAMGIDIDSELLLSRGLGLKVLDITRKKANGVGKIKKEIDEYAAAIKAIVEVLGGG